MEHYPQGIFRFHLPQIPLVGATWQNIADADHYYQTALSAHQHTKIKTSEISKQGLLTINFQP